MTEQKQLSTEVSSVTSELSAMLGIDRSQMIKTIKAQCFKCRPELITNEQLAAFSQVAVALKVNPLLPNMLYAFPTKGGGIEPMVGPDGMHYLLSSHPRIKGWQTRTYYDNEADDLAAEAKIFVEGYDQPIIKICYLKEWRNPGNQNWISKPRHMLEGKALKHGARQIIHGLPSMDEDEIKQVIDSDPTPAESPERPQAPTPRRGIAGAKATIKQEIQPAERPAVKEEPKEEILDAEFTESTPEEPEEPEPEEPKKPEPEEPSRIATKSLELDAVINGAIIKIESTKPHVTSKGDNILIMKVSGEIEGQVYAWDSLNPLYKTGETLAVSATGIAASGGKTAIQITEAEPVSF